jgi:hypothetical protein
MASLVVHTLPERRRVAVRTHRMRPVAHTLEPSVARMEQALAATDRSCMLERHCRRTTTAGRGGRGGDGLTWLLLRTEIPPPKPELTRALEDKSLKRLL